MIWLQVNLCQKLLFLHQPTHNMTTDCSLNYKFNTWKFQAQTWREHAVYRNCFWHSKQFLYATCSPHVRRASDKDLPVQKWNIHHSWKVSWLEKQTFRYIVSKKSNIIWLFLKWLWFFFLFCLIRCNVFEKRNN